MITDFTGRIKVIRIILWIESVMVFFWWPITHFFFSDWYHSLLGFKAGTYPRPMVTVIGACGLCIVAFSILAAINPRKNRNIIIGLIITAYILAIMYAYLVFTGLFPSGEILNLIICLLSGTIILTVYPWKIDKEA